VSTEGDYVLVRSSAEQKDVSTVNGKVHSTVRRLSTPAALRVAHTRASFMLQCIKVAKIPRLRCAGARRAFPCERGRRSIAPTQTAHVVFNAICELAFLGDKIALAPVKR
jgi:hypothetical protein